MGNYNQEESGGEAQLPGRPISSDGAKLTLLETPGAGGEKKKATKDELKDAADGTTWMRLEPVGDTSDVRIMSPRKTKLVLDPVVQPGARRLRRVSYKVMREAVAVDGEVFRTFYTTYVLVDENTVGSPTWSPLSVGSTNPGSPAPVTVAASRKQWGDGAAPVGTEIRTRYISYVFNGEFTNTFTRFATSTLAPASATASPLSPSALNSS